MWREHHTEHRNDGIEAGVVRVDRLGIADFEANIQTFVRGLCNGLLDQVRRNVDSGGSRASTCCRKGEVTGPACDVEHTFARLDAEPCNEFCSTRLIPGRDAT